MTAAYSALAGRPVVVADPSGQVNGPPLANLVRQQRAQAEAQNQRNAEYIARLETIMKAQEGLASSLCIVKSAGKKRKMLGLGDINVLRAAVSRLNVEIDLSLERGVEAVFQRIPAIFGLWIKRIACRGPVAQMGDEAIVEEAMHAALYYDTRSYQIWKDESLMDLALGLTFGPSREGSALWHLKQLDEQLKGWQERFECDPWKASLYWAQFERAAQEPHRKLSGPYRAVVGIFIDLDAIKEFYLAGECGGCCGESPIGDIIAGGYVTW
jgi:hypothetical protein